MQKFIRVRPKDDLAITHHSFLIPLSEVVTIDEGAQPTKVFTADKTYFVEEIDAAYALGTVIPAEQGYKLWQYQQKTGTIDDTLVFVGNIVAWLQHSPYSSPSPISDWDGLKLDDWIISRPGGTYYTYDSEKPGPDEMLKYLREINNA